MISLFLIVKTHLLGLHSGLVNLHLMYTDHLVTVLLCTHCMATELNFVNTTSTKIYIQFNA